MINHPTTLLASDDVTKGGPIMNGDEIVVLTETSADLKIILETFDAAIGSTQAFTIEVSPVPDGMYNESRPYTKAVN